MQGSAPCSPASLCFYSPVPATSPSKAYSPYAAEHMEQESTAHKQSQPAHLFNQRIALKRLTGSLVARLVTLYVTSAKQSLNFTSPLIWQQLLPQSIENTIGAAYAMETQRVQYISRVLLLTRGGSH